MLTRYLCRPTRRFAANCGVNSPCAGLSVPSRVPEGVPRRGANQPFVSELARRILRKSIGSMRDQWLHCSKCRRTPVPGEFVHRLESERIVCSLCLAKVSAAAARRRQWPSASTRASGTCRSPVAPPDPGASIESRPVGPVTVETVISAPREAVFDFVGDLANHVAFTDHFSSDFRLARTKSDGLGAAARFRLENPGPEAVGRGAVQRLRAPAPDRRRRPIRAVGAVTSSGPSGISARRARRREWN